MNPHDISKRKLRGGRAHFRRVRHWAATFRIDLSPGKWYDLWHTHPDHLGWSVKGHGARRAHLTALFEAFNRVLEQTRSHEGPYQTFLAVSHQDPLGNALYFHTPNPNEENFPHSFSRYRWEVTAPAWLAEFVDPQQFEVGETRFENQLTYVVVPRGQGGRA